MLVNYKLIPAQEAGKPGQLDILYSKEPIGEFDQGTVQFEPTLLHFQYTLLKFLGTEDTYQIVGDPLVDDQFAVAIRIGNISEKLKLDDLFEKKDIEYKSIDFQS